MPPAASIADLLRIRQAHLNELRRQPNYRGSAVGYKFLEHQNAIARENDASIPAVILFVEAKVPDLADNQRFDEGRNRQLTITDSAGQSISAATDVVASGYADGIPWVPRLAPAAEARRRAVVESHEISGGIPVRSPFLTGTAGCVIRYGPGRRQLALLTNAHVAGQPGLAIERPEPTVLPVGQTGRSHLLAAEASKAKAPLDAWMDSQAWLDAAAIDLDPAILPHVQPGVIGLGSIQPADPPALESLDLLGELVISVGATCGQRYGRIVGVGYEWAQDGSYYHADYLILGCDDSPQHNFNRVPFAAEGDSGKLVLLAKGLQPLGLLWGGHRLQFGSSMASQEAWCLATDISRVLSALDAEIVELPTSSTAA